MNEHHWYTCKIQCSHKNGFPIGLLPMPGIVITALGCIRHFVIILVWRIIS